MLSLHCTSIVVASLIDLGVDPREVVLPLCQDTSASTNEVVHPKEGHGGRHEKSHFDDVEGQNRIAAGDSEVGRTAELAANGDAAGLEDVVEVLGPARLVSASGLEEGLTDVKMRSLNDAIGL